MTGSITSLPSTGTGAALASSAGLVGLSQGWIILMVFGFLIAGLTVYNLGRLQVSERFLRRNDRLD